MHAKEIRHKTRSEFSVCVPSKLLAGNASIEASKYRAGEMQQSPKIASRGAADV